RNFDFENGSLTRFALQFDRPGDFLDVRLDNVHPYAPTGHIGYLLSGRESRQENESRYFSVSHTRGLFRRDEAAFQRSLLHTLEVDAAAVITDFDVDLAAFMVGFQR